MRVWPTRSGIVIAALALAVTFSALNTGINLIYLLVSFLYALLIMGLVLPILALRRVTASRMPPEGVFADERFAVDVELSNPKRLLSAVSIIVEDVASRGGDEASARCHAVRVGPRGRLVVSYEMRLARRGRYTLERLRLTTSYPFGLFRASKVVREPRTLWVYPSMGALAPAVQLPYSPAFEAGSGQSHHRGGHQEFFGLREYQSGDSLRLVHWKSSARSSRLMVKEFERDDAQAVLVAVHCPRPPLDAVEEARFETAVSFATSLAHRLVMQGRSVSVAAGSDHVRVAHNKGRGGLSADLLRLLAGIGSVEQAPLSGPDDLPENALTVAVISKDRAEGLRALSRAGIRPDRVFDCADPAFARLFRERRRHDEPKAAPRPASAVPGAYPMILIGALAMSLGSEEVPWAFLLAGMAVAAFWLIERRIGRALHAPRLGRLIVVAGSGYAAVAPFLLGRHVAIAAAEYVLVCQFAMLLISRDERQSAWVFLITLAELAVGTVRTVDICFGVTLFILAVVGARTLGRGRLRFDALAVAGTDAAVGPDLRKLVAWRRAAALALCGMTITLAIFFALPRVEGNLLARTQAETMSVTGFSAQVQLGDVGRILPSSRKVMQVELFTGPDDAPFRAEGRGLLLRGISLDHYDGATWSATVDKRMRGAARWERARLGDAASRRPQAAGLSVKQVITMEPIDTDVLFCLSPVVRFYLSPGYFLFRAPVAGAYYTHRSHSAYFRYTVVSRIVPGGQPPIDKDARVDDLHPLAREAYLQLPDRLSPRIAELARSLVARAKAATDLAKSQALRAYLESPRNFQYSLDAAHTPGKEPVEDFLFEQRAGHCEFFAAAMAVMLRTLGIPSRLVNGFHLGEWNDFGGFYTVRQSDAHSWVEAYLAGRGWTTFDPTPKADEDLSTARRLGALLWQAVELAESEWVDYVIGYGQSEQRELLSWLRARVGPFGDKWAPVLLKPLQWLSLLGKKAPLKASPEGPDAADGGAFAMRCIIFAAIILTCGWIGLRMRIGPLRRFSRSAPQGVTAEYKRFLAVTARCGFQKDPAETPGEFLERLRGLSAVRFEAARQVTAIFSLARYGGRDVAAQEIRALRGCVKRLAARK